MSGDRTEPSGRGEEFLQLFSRGMEFTKELLRENERLRRRIVELEDEQLSIEKENAGLANLYVASHQLHSTLQIDEVLRITIEIAINLIGAEVFAIHLLDEERQELRAVAAEGIELGRVPACRVGEGPLGEAVGERSIRISGDESAREPDPERPLACVPLCVDDRAVGAIAILGLLPQKQGFSASDRELLGVLAGHAATAISAARLHARSERTLDTIQGLIDRLAR